MREEVLESYIRQYIEAHNAEYVNFAWQGGEPALLGVNYFRLVRDLQRRYANGKRITNAFQTNGVLLNDPYMRFMAAGLAASYPHSNVMRWVAAADIRSGRFGRNDPCPCSSGRRFKQCCQS